MRPLIVAVSLATALVMTARGQSPQSTFRGGVDLVQVDVSVLDHDRKPVRGLAAADFTVFEDGKPRPISAFTAVDLPVRDVAIAPWESAVAPAAATNALPQEGRLVVILLDRSIPDGFPTVNAKNIAKAAVRELGPADLAAVLFTRSGTQQGFTNDHAKLISAIDGSYPAGELSDAALEQWQSLLQAMIFPGNFASTGADMLEYSTDCPCGVCVLDTIGHVADAVREIPSRRKSLLFIGSNLSIEVPAQNPCATATHAARDRMFKSLDLASLTVHSIDARGLETLASTASSRAFQYRGRENLERQGNIAVLPDRTGGRTVVNTNNPMTRVPEIFAESGSYYLLGFAPATADGKRHDISVKVNRRGVDVRTRRGYVASAPGSSSTTQTSQPAYASAISATEGLLPARDGVAITATTAIFADVRTHEPVVTVALHAQHEPPAGGAVVRPGAEQVDLVTRVFTMSGHSIGTLRQVLNVTPQSAAGTVSYDVLQRLPAKPGRYELRIGLQNVARHQTGSVYTFIDVPDFSKAAFAASDLALYAPMGMPASTQDLTDILLAPATGRRDLERSEHATAFMRLYQPATGAASAVQMTTSIVDDHNRRRYGQQTAIDASSFSAGGSDYIVNLPLADLDPGSYLLSIAAKAGIFVERREMKFSVK